MAPPQVTYQIKKTLQGLETIVEVDSLFLSDFVHFICDFRLCLHYGAGWIGYGFRILEFWWDP